MQDYQNLENDEFKDDDIESEIDMVNDCIKSNSKKPEKL